MTQDLKFLINAVEEANKLITDDFEVKAKGNHGDLVTNFDFEIEKFIIDKINSNYPGFTVVSEEFNKNAKLTDNCFTIDPIDGTINFAHSLPLWGIQVALIKNGQTVAAVIYLPKFNELYSADETGAFLNGKKLEIKPLPVNRCLYSIEGKNRTPAIDRLKKYTSHARWIGSASVDFAWVSSCKLGGTIFRNESVWDYKPGMFICKQAGAYIIDEVGAHIAACSQEFAQVLKEEATFRPEDEEEKFSF